MKRLFPSALEHSANLAKPTNREADYMCFSPLRRKTSELGGEEEYTSRLGSRNLRDR
jgi:hypothetical protein